MRQIHVLGAGAMGCLWTSYFDLLVAQGRHQLTFVVRNLERWQTVTHITCEPNNTRTPVNVADRTSCTVVEHLIVATKAPQALEAIRSIEHLLAPTCQILLLQNGMGSQQQVAQAFPHLSVYACSSTEGAYKTQDDTVVHAGRGENHIGPLTATATIEGLSAWLPAERFTWFDDIETVLWRKLVVNAAINPLTVYYHCQNGQLLQNPQALAHMNRLCDELAVLLNAKQLAITNPFELATQVCRRTAKNFSSMYKDAEAGRKTEIDFINGYIVKECHRLNLPCPAHEEIVNHISGLSS